jgi:hypothetical protein
MSGNSTPSNTTNSQTIRYAPYVEDHHVGFLNLMNVHELIAIENNPFTLFSAIPVNEAFFGTGYIISDFPSLYDMYGKFLAGLDVETLFDQVFEGTVNSPIVNDLIAAESALMDDDIEINSLPRIQAGMRDINSVMSSTFIIGKALVEDAKVKSLAKFSADLKYRLIPVAQSRWATHLEWNNKVVGLYAELMKFYYSTKLDVDEFSYSHESKKQLWPFTVLDFERAALGTLQGATNSKENVAGASTISKVIGGALSGAAMGAMVGSTFNTASSGVQGTSSYVAASSAGTTYGAGIGAVLGAAAAYTY